MENIITAFRDAMGAAGYPYSGNIIADGKLHRVTIDGDRPRSDTGYYLLHADERPAGFFGSWKTGGEKISWSMKGAKTLSPAERRALSEKIERDKAQRDAEMAAKRAAAATAANALWNAAPPADNAHPYLRKKGVDSYGLRGATWVRDFGHDRVTGEVREHRIENALLVPLRDGKKVIHNVQAIFPAKDDRLDRDKDFLLGGAKRGLWYAIGKPVIHEGRKVVVVAEGYATAASVHLATGLGVIVAFDAGNLAPVAERLRAIMPDALILFAADNDQWTKVGTIENPGLSKARAAAELVGGLVVWPEFQSLEGRPTDFNDLHKAEGVEEVRRQVMEGLRPPKPAEPTPEPPLPDGPPEEEPPPHLEAPPEPVGPRSEASAPAAATVAPAAKPPRASRPPPATDDDTDEDGADPQLYFTVLGHDRDNLFVYSHEKKMVIRRSETAWSKDALMSIAPLQWWEMHFQGEKGLAKDAAVNWLLRKANKRGFYDPTRVRGRGAWMDDGRIVYHFGDQLWVDGQVMDVTAIKSKFVYEQGKKLPALSDIAMTDKEGMELLRIAKQFRWARDASALLLAGWVALGPICGALSWRPHIWLTGGAGAGKSTVLNFYMHFLMGGTAIFAQGNSTEAGIRQELQSDALPVLFDEAEQNDEREQLRMQSAIALIRQSSTESEAKTLKGSTHGTSIRYMIRSMFGLSSIQVGIRHQADYERISILGLRGSDKSVQSEEQAVWAGLKADLARINADKTLSARLVRRTLDLLPITLKNIETFTQAAAAKFGSQRDGDQYGALLAGAWSLCSSRLATLDEATGILNRYDWSDYRENVEHDESRKALQALLGAMIRLPRGQMVTINELVRRAAGIEVAAMDSTSVDADAILRRHGIGVVMHGADPMAAEMLVANDSIERDKLLAGTPFQADLKGMLLRVEGATKCDPVSFNGLKCRCISIPLHEILGDAPMLASRGRAPEDDEVPF